MRYANGPRTQYSAERTAFFTKLIKVLEHTYFDYDKQYFLLAHNDLVDLHKILSDIHPDIVRLMSRRVSQELHTNFMKSLFKETKLAIPISRREYFDFPVDTIEQWSEGWQNFIIHEQLYLSDKRDRADRAILRATGAQDIGGRLRQFIPICQASGFNLGTIKTYLENYLKPMDYNVIADHSAPQQAWDMKLLVEQLDIHTRDAPKELRDELPKIVADFLNNEALYKLRERSNVNNNQYYVAIPKLEFPELRSFLIQDKTLMFGHINLVARRFTWETVPGPAPANNAF